MKLPFPDQKIEQNVIPFRRRSWRRPRPSNRRKMTTKVSNLLTNCLGSIKNVFLSMTTFALMIVAAIGLGTVILILKIIRWIVCFVGGVLGICILGMTGICAILALLANGKVPPTFWPGLWKMELIFVPQFLGVLLIVMLVMALELWFSRQGYQIQKLRTLFKSS